MNSPTNTVAEAPLGGRAVADAAAAASRTAYWLVRRELWENRSIYIAPLAVGGVALLGFLFSLVWLPANVRKMQAVDPARKLALAAPYDFVAIAIILVTVLVGWYYCLEALHSERRDRSILFWKSLPVSDLTTVLTKASIPMVVLPLLAFAVIVATQLVMLLLGTLVLWSNGASIPVLWAEVPLMRTSPVLLYGLATLALWYAPIYGWLLLVSAWAQRATLLWAVLTPVLITIIERLAFHTSYFGSMLRERLFHGFAHAFVVQAQGNGAALGGGTRAGGMSHEQLAQILNPIPDPAKFLAGGEVWIGLAVAAAFIAVTVWLRRHREPM